MIIYFLFFSQVVKCVCYRIPLPDEEEDEEELEKEEDLEKKKLSPNFTGSPHITGSPPVVLTFGETNSRASPSKDSESLSTSRRASRSFFHIKFL